jgi:hypothetical protein
MLVSITDGERNINRYVERFIWRLNTAIFYSLPEVDRRIDRHSGAIIDCESLCSTLLTSVITFSDNLSIIDYLVSRKLHHNLLQSHRYMYHYSTVSSTLSLGGALRK